METLVLVFFGIWAALSLTVLVPKVGPRLRHRDWLGLIPEWKFFAPIPGRGDFHFLYRDLYGEVATEWTEVELGGPRCWWNCLWHPGRRDRKAAFDLARELGMHATPEKQGALHLTVPYLALLQYVSGMPRTVKPSRTQFLLMYREAGIGEPEISVLSRAHEVDP